LRGPPRHTSQKEELPKRGIARMVKKYKKESQFKTRWYHRMPRYWFQKDLVRPEGVRETPELFRLDVESGVKPNRKPPVRIFLGTEAGQFRAERVFVWSVMQVRDPARVYEIYFMKDLKGYDRTGWKTGFTNYRYGIPAMGGGKGRAIYNDVDQLYLADPGEMFDLDMGGAGILGITERETSVMLIDCEKMIKYWTLHDAQHGKKHGYFRDVVHDNKLWGRLPAEWNARDDEFTADRSKCFHFTTLQTQPWQPFPDVLRYEPHPDGEVWFSRERAADAAGFNIFAKDRPSQRYMEVLEQYKLLRDAQGKVALLAAKAVVERRSLALHEAEIRELIVQVGGKSVLDYFCGKGDQYLQVQGEDEKARVRSLAAWPGVRVTCYDTLHQPFSAAVKGKFDMVLSVDALQHIPEEDIGWVLDEMFGAARHIVYLAVSTVPAKDKLPNGAPTPCNVQPLEWWKGQLELASKRCPGVRWRIRGVEKDGSLRGSRTYDGIGDMEKAA
jgi:hypothetical protein